ncbi:MAG: Fe-S cluster assembly protein HesB [Acidimicrobiia bacterium]|nr:Fe-S cluster assembly protein HesB [Acidimicrobiia bacterium]MYC56972.1 Fe-S cluster assembly protein HesB [Acidimicrobiia bacterium]MYG94096.1 Fe-S cluster assembly protein HesB [Acidimicrobiia bacterium]MYI30837.1 Fe-S cluster assembly protein HesB [Acidimicrobiia bacterium]
MAAMGTLAVTGDHEADQLLLDDPFALLLAMMLDQQIPMEWAFKSPLRLKKRIPNDFSAKRLAALNPDTAEAAFKEKPALHRFPGSMARRAQELARHIVTNYHGDAANIWNDTNTGQELLGRLQALPGYGEEKAKIFLALLAKRFGVKPQGWEQACMPFADGTPRTVADIDGPNALASVRAWKKAQKAKGKSKSD